jgi:hypothetical protein
MSNLNFLEKKKLEQLFEMGGGFVLDFSDRTFADFMAESTRKDIWNEGYLYRSGSKANRLRAFWKVEPNYLVGKLLTDLLEYCHNSSTGEKGLWVECHEIAERLLQDKTVPEIDAVYEDGTGGTFDKLAKEVRDAIERNEPEAGLDRLHAYTVMYTRLLCEKHGIEVEKEKPLHSVFGEYVKHLKGEGMIESVMTERILKMSISVLDSFNSVRNDRSLAHANPLLSRSESFLIYNNMANLIRFVRELEVISDARNKPAEQSESEDEDLPF